MPLPHLEILEKAGYLHFRVSGENTPENVAWYFGQVLRTCLERQTAQVLIEENLQGPGLSMGRVFQVASQASENVRPAIDRVAYVDTNPEHSVDLMKFAETVASNRGVNVRVFAKFSEAEAWLASKK